MEERLKRFLEDWANSLVEDYKGKLSSGDLKNSITSRVTLDLNNIRISLYLNDYWKYLEEGRKPGKFPPINKMLKIARRVIPKPYRLPNGKTVLPTEKQLAYLIGRKISRDGTKPTHYLEDSLNNKKQELIDGLSTILVDEFKELILKVN